MPKTDDSYSLALELFLDAEEGVVCALDAAELERCVRFVLEQEQVTGACELSLSMVSDEHMRELNRAWRGIDRPTDVLSLECESPFEDARDFAVPVMLGDIVLAPSYIAAQAANFKTTEADETRLLLVHGILHLLGYDHEEEEMARTMEAREDQLVALLGGDGSLGAVRIVRHGRGDEE
ncbi:MAG: rRNA maturation RNase YbeY [Atopobiaceae bacterium]|nr:rRNA maturation RNase YbeY [Atopobiaceae bacterium]